MEFSKALQWRYATKRMIDKKLAPTDLNRILDAIHLAPSSMGLQPYSVFVIGEGNLKDEIVEKSCPQPQAKESSHLLVFAAWDRENLDQEIEDYMANMASTRNVDRTKLNGFHSMVSGFVKGLKGGSFEWCARQAYLGLGFALSAAALAGIDAGPMEGFNSGELDRILDLESKGMKSLVIVALGYRDSEKDHYATAAKVRRPKNEFIIEL